VKHQLTEEVGEELWLTVKFDGDKDGVEEDKDDDEPIEHLRLDDVPNFEPSTHNFYPHTFPHCYDVSVHLSVCLSATEVHWCIIANLGFKFRSQFTAHCGRGACRREH